MSYILDALKKSEEERRRGRIPTLHDRHDQESGSSAQLERRRGGVLWVIGLLALISLALVSWRWSVVKEPPTQELTVSADTEIQERDHQPDPGRVVAEESPGRYAMKNNQTETREERPIPQSAEDPTDAVVIQPAPLDEPGSTASRPVLPEPAFVESSNLPLLAELPAEQRKIVPSISIEGHVYAEDSARRMVMINKRVLREGEMAGNGIKLLRITWDGVVLRHADTEFQVKIE